MLVKRDKFGRFVKGERNISWKGGRNYDGQGYVRVWKPEHPNNNNGYVLEHRLVIEKKIGRYLKKGEVVHHINGVRDDNRVENLVIMTRHKHPANHQVGRAVSKQTRQKISKKLMGHKVTDRTRKAVSKSNRKRYASGEKFGFQKGNSYGK